MSSDSEEEFVGDEDSDDEPTQDDDDDDDDDEEEEFDGEDEDEDDDDWKDQEPVTKGTASRKRKSAADIEDSDDDDIPLAKLASSKKSSNGDKKPAAVTKTRKPTKSTTKKKKSKAKAATQSASSRSKANDGGHQSASSALYGSDCKKGQLIQRLLCRWWFCITWPDPSSLPEKPPANYDSLDGFPGVYIATQGEEVGKILDLRDGDECPNFRNFARKSSKELQTLLIKALEKQKKELIKVDGTGTTTENELDEMMKWAQKINPITADKEAAKVLKAAGQTLE